MGKKVNLIIIAHDFPYPPNHGGRVDMWNRIVALSNRGVNIFLIAWSDQDINIDDINKVKEFTSKVKIFKRNKQIYKAFHPLLPSHVTTRGLQKYEYLTLLEDLGRFKADIIVLDGLPGALLALDLQSDLSLPLIYRSHNVEYLYINELYLAEKKPFKKYLLKLNVRRTKLIEKKIRTKSSVIYEISYSDKKHWENKHNVAQKVLNPFVLLRKKEIPFQFENEQDIDLLYVGNLHTPNNLYGLEWFISKVVPLIKNMRIIIAGSNPNDRIIGLCEQAGIELVSNPETVSDLYNRAKLLINPIFHGSGVNIKMIEMLSTGKPIVSTSVGARGLVENVKKYVYVADHPEDFAAGIKQNILKDNNDTQISDVLGEYSWENVDVILNEISLLIEG